MLKQKNSKPLYVPQMRIQTTRHTIPSPNQGWCNEDWSNNVWL